MWLFAHCRSSQSRQALQIAFYAPLIWPTCNTLHETPQYFFLMFRFEPTLGCSPFSEENIKFQGNLAIYQLLSFFRRMTILLKMWFSPSHKMDDVSAWNRIVYFVNARGINFSFSSCHLLWRTSCQVQYSSPRMSYQDLFFWQKSRCNQNWSESLSISEACMGMNYTESCLAKFQHFFYHFSFTTFILLRKLYACSFNAKNTKQLAFFPAVCSYVSEYTLTGTKYRSNTATSPL